MVKSLGLMLLAAMALLGASCADDPTGDATVLVFAAASLSDAFAEMESTFEMAHPGLDIQLNLAGSSSLREQINEGAPADVFASANEAIMDEVVRAGATPATPQIFSHNVLQLAVPAGNPGDVAQLADLAKTELAVGLCAAGVPCGDLAREALKQAGVDAAIDTNEPDVRALLTKLRADELDAGIVYHSDVIAAGKDVQGLDLAELSRIGTNYPIVVVAESPHPAEAKLFVDFVLSDQGQDIMAAFGFATP